MNFPFKTYQFCREKFDMFKTSLFINLKLLKEKLLTSQLAAYFKVQQRGSYPMPITLGGAVTFLGFKQIAYNPVHIIPGVLWHSENL